MAGFSLPPIHLELLLVISLVSIAIDKITKTGTSVFNAPFQDLENGFKQAFLFRFA